MFGFPKLKLLFGNEISCGYRVTWSFAHHIVESGGQEAHINADMLAATMAVSNKPSIVSHLGVLCLLPAFMKLWQVSLLACE